MINSKMRRLYEMREDGVRDYVSGINEARREGKAEGVREKALKTAQNLLQIGLDVKTIAQSVELPVKEIEKLRQSKS